MQKVIKAIKYCVASKTCCEETGVDCNQGRDCPVREGTHKPAEAVHQIQEPTVNQQLTSEREAFEAWAREYGTWDVERDDVQSIGIASYTDVAVVVAWHAWKARAALAATPAAELATIPAELATQAAQPVLPTGWVPCVVTYEGQHPEEVAYGPQIMMDRLKKWLERYFEMKAAAPVVLPEPVAAESRFTSFSGDRWKWCTVEHARAFGQDKGYEVRYLYTEQQVRSLLATASAETEPFGYFKAEPFGWTDCGPDDEGAVALYEKPQVLATGGQARAALSRCARKETHEREDH